MKALLYEREHEIPFAKKACGPNERLELALRNKSLRFFKGSRKKAKSVGKKKNHTMVQTNHAAES